MVSNKIFQSLWIGPPSGEPIGTMERLCMSSFMKNGHEFHLYVYGPLENVPSGVVIQDANEIVPEEFSKQFRYPAQASNYFFHMLLLKKGGWVTDMDNICLRTFDMAEDYVFYKAAGTSVITTAIAKCPPDSRVMKYCCDYVDRMSPEERGQLSYQAIGPDLVSNAVPMFSLRRFVRAGVTFDPIHWDRAKLVVDPTQKWELKYSYSLHLCHAAWNNNCQSTAAPGESPSTEGQYHPDCLYEQLKRRYLS
jgi:hypothetical protein